MNKQEFHEKLIQRKVEHINYRPFQCVGHPFEAPLFVVGVNPATPGLPNWWDFWDAEQGFDFERFEAKYLRFRRNKPSPTRKRINALREGIGSDVLWVETNLYPIASKKSSEMPLEGYNTDHLDLLLDACQPRVIFAHGADPRGHFAEKIDQDLPDVDGGEYSGPYHWPGRETVLFFSRQLAYGPSEDALRRLGNCIRQRYLGLEGDQPPESDDCSYSDLGGTQYLLRKMGLNLIS